MIFKNKILRIALRQILPIGILLAGVSSCSVSQSVAGETDGIYFDPNTDEMPVYTSTYEEEDYYSPQGDESLVRIGGKYFDENGNAPVMRKQKSPYDTRDTRKSQYPTWGDETDNLNVSFNYFGSPFYNGFGWGVNYGYNWNYPYYGYNSPFINSGIYWGYPYYGYSPYYYSVWDPFYDPYYYTPYYYGPYRGYYGYGYGRYNPYYGSYYPGYYRNVKPIRRGKGMNSNVTVSENNSNSVYRSNNRKTRVRRDRGYRNDYSNDRPTRFRQESYRSSNSWSNPSNSNNSWRSSSSSVPSTRSYTPSRSGGNRNGRVVFE